MTWLMIAAVFVILWLTTAVACAVWLIRAMVREAEHGSVQARPGSGVR